MRLPNSILSLILISLTPLMSFVTFEGVGYASLHYEFNGVYENYSRRIRIGDPINLYEPQDAIFTVSGEGQVAAFEGWYSNADLLDAFEIFTMPHEDLSVYAKWSLNSWNGNSFQNYLYSMSINQSYSINVRYSGGQYFILMFRPLSSRSYRFQSSSIPGSAAYQDTFAYLYNDSNENYIGYNNSSAGNGHFRIDHNLIANRTYFLKVLFSSTWTTGTFYVSVT